MIVMFVFQQTHLAKSVHLLIPISLSPAHLLTKLLIGAFGKSSPAFTLDSQ